MRGLSRVVSKGYYLIPQGFGGTGIKHKILN